MRIALTITELYPGGAERCFTALARFLKARGHEVQVWQLWPETPAEHADLVEQLRGSGIEVRSGGAVHAWDFVKATMWLRKELARFQPEVVQSFLFHANLATSLSLPSKTPFFGGARVRQPERLRQTLQRQASRRMEKLICVSESVREHCVAVEKIAKEKTLVIPNGIDPAATEVIPAQWSDIGVKVEEEQGGQSSVILFVGRLTEQKGILPLLRESNRFLSMLDHQHLVIIGDGVQREQAEAIVKDHPFRHRIHLTGWQPNPMRFMSISRCLVLPAIYEGMPNVVLEAMAMGIPTVCFEVDGVRELLGNSELADAQIAAPGDFADLSRKTAELCKNSNLHKACSQQNRQRVRDYFLLSDQLARYEELYEAAISGQEH